MIPAATALVLYVTYLLVTFGLRGWLHHRNTGTAGFNGFTERPGSAGWRGGILFAVAVLTGSVCRRARRSRCRCAVSVRR